MYLVFNALEHAATDREKGFALFSELIVMFIYGALAATITGLGFSNKSVICSAVLVCFGKL